MSILLTAKARLASNASNGRDGRRGADLNRSSNPCSTPMPTHEASNTRERPVRAGGRRRKRGDGMAGAVRVRVERLRTRGPAGVQCARARSRARVPAARARVRRLAGGACAVCATARIVGRGSARGVPDGGRALPACRGGARCVAVRADARRRTADAVAGDGAGSVRRQPADAAGPGTGPSRGTAGRVPVCRRCAAGRPRPAPVGRSAAGAGDREQAVGAARGRTCAAGAPVTAWQVGRRRQAAL